MVKRLQLMPSVAASSAPRKPKKMIWAGFSEPLVSCALRTPHIFFSSLQ
jgi:hypothetical protein